MLKEKAMTLVAIKLLDGQYEGIIYKYNEVKFSQTENANGEIPLKFTYDVMTNPNERRC